MSTDLPEPRPEDREDPSLGRYDDEDREEALADEQALRGGSRRWWVIGGLLVAAATAVAVWFGVANATDAVTYRDLGYHVDSASQVTARWEIEKPTDKTVSCLVRALDAKFGVVGAVDVEIPAGVSQRVVTTTIRTTSQAVTGTVRRCVLADG